MNFRDFATDEAATLVRRLLAHRSEQASHDLQAFQDALNAATDLLRTSVARSAETDSDAELAALVERIAAAAEADKQLAADEAASQARAAIEAVRVELRTQTEHAAELTESLAAAQGQTESLRQELQAVSNKVAALEAERSKAHEAVSRAEAGRADAEKAHQHETSARARFEHELQTVQDLLTTTRAQSAAIAKQLDVEAAERARLTVDLTAAESLLHAAEEQRQAMAAEAQVAGARLAFLEGAYADAERVQHELEARLETATKSEAQVRAEAAESERQMREARAELESAAQARSQAERTLDQSSTDTKTWRAEQAASVRQHAVTFLSRSLDRLRACSDELADASSADELFAALVTVFASEFSRVALFSVKHNRLEGIRQVGFEAQPDMSQLLIPRTLDSLLTRAVVSGHIETLAGGELDDASGSPFGGTPGSVWAIPIEVDGAAAAVIYADDSDQARTEFGNLELRTKFADLLSKQAGAALARLPVAHESPDLREYAGRLVSELESMYGADVSMGRKKDELRSRLRDNLDCARRMYAERIASETGAVAALLEDHLAAVARTGTDFAKELGKLLKGRDTTATNDQPKRRTAEAR
jgi:chromosome segregation ATPase